MNTSRKSLEVAPAEDVTSSTPSPPEDETQDEGGIWSIDPIHQPGMLPGVPIESLPEFEYGPQLPEGHIRVLVLAPRREEESFEDRNWLLACDLLSNWNQYTAVSYTWGDPTKTHKIRCNGKSLAVTETVYEALTNLGRLFEGAGTIPMVWIDALCINQGHFGEREEQVKMMRDIYRAAHNTFVWLPVGRNASDKELEQIDKAFDSMVMLGEMYQVDQFKEMVVQGKLSFDTLDHMKYGDMELRVPWENRGGMKKLFTQSWFERIWVCQEVAVSKAPIVFDGIHVGPWEVFADNAEIAQHLGGLDNYIKWSSNEVSTDDTFIANVCQLESFRKRVGEGATTGLLELLHATANFQSTEPLDRVYGLLGLITEEQDRDIVTSLLDYTMAPYMLYLNVAVNHIIQHGTLDILHLVAPVHFDPAGKWLSIVPNLASSNNRKRAIGTFQSRNEWKYHASLDTQPELKIDGKSPEAGKFIRIIDANEMSLGGFILDTVSRTSQMLDSAGMSMKSMMTWFQVAMYSSSCVRYIPGGVMRRHLDYIASRAKAVEELSSNENSEPVASNTEEKLPEKIDPEILKLLENVKLGPDGKPLGDDESGDDESGPEAGPDDQNEQSPASKAVVPAKKSSSRDLGGEIYPGGKEIYGSAFWRTLIGNRDPRQHDHNIKPNAEVAERFFKPWSQLLFADDGEFMSQSWMHEWSKEHSGFSGDKAVTTFAKWVEDVSLGRKMFRTEKGYIGTAPVTIQDGDLICVLKGGQTPYALRREEEGYRFIGACYVHGVMDGEVMGMGLEEVAFVFV
ncbi:HET-domain-containing protein [Thozetella sp. PMI_491]|nr:HET-domain-containing protein [Thozetella sp. PMI_491]